MFPTRSFYREDPAAPAAGRTARWAGASSPQPSAATRAGRASADGNVEGLAGMDGRGGQVVELGDIGHDIAGVAVEVEVRGHGPQRLALVDDDLLGVDADGLRLGFGESGSRDRMGGVHDRSADADDRNRLGSETTYRQATTGGQALASALCIHRFTIFIRTIPPPIDRTSVLFNMPIPQIASTTPTFMRQ